MSNSNYIERTTLQQVVVKTISCSSGNVGQSNPIPLPAGAEIVVFQKDLMPPGNLLKTHSFAMYVGPANPTFDGQMFYSDMAIPLTMIDTVVPKP